jgi:molecular chaperone HscB
MEADSSQPDAFEVLGLAPRFAVAPAELERAFVAASSANHPDRFRDPLEQAEAAERSAAINAAYRTLKAPASRAEALLQRLGGSAKEEDRSLPQDVLMEMMEVRESLEEAAAAGDSAKLGEWRTWADERREAHLSRIAEALEAAATAPDAEASRPHLDAARLELNQLRYIDRMLEQMPD